MGRRSSPSDPPRRLTASERAYLDTLFQECYRKLYGVACRHLHELCADAVEDAVQETFLRACAGFQSMVQYDSAEAWLVRVCHHVAVDEARFLMRTRKLLDNLPEQAGHGGASGLQELLPADFPEEYADLLIRYYRDRNTTVELARDLGLAPAAVRKRLSRARQRLKEYLEP